MRSKTSIAITGFHSSIRAIPHIGTAESLTPFTYIAITMLLSWTTYRQYFSMWRSFWKLKRSHGGYATMTLLPSKKVSNALFIEYLLAWNSPSSH
jgi:hypothetical protein